MKKITILLCTVILAFLAVGCSDRAGAAAIPSMIPQKVTVESMSEEMTDAVNLAEGTYVAGSDETADSLQAVQKETIAREGGVQMKISVTANGNTIVFGLNDSPAAKELYAQLPLILEVENFSTNEKVFYPPQKLDTTNTPMADAEKGTLAYYAPWGDVVMFYEHFGKGSSLYELGEVISGKELIESLSGTIKITAVDE